TQTMLLPAESLKLTVVSSLGGSRGLRNMAALMLFAIESHFSSQRPCPNQSMKPTTPLRDKFSVFATTPSTSSRCPAYAPASASILFPAFRFAAERRDFPSAIRVFALTHSRRNVAQRYRVAYLFLVRRSFMDRSYKEDIPSTRRALEELKKEFSSVASTTDWTKLRIEPLLDHVKSLERLLRSPKFARETA